MLMLMRLLCKTAPMSQDGLFLYCPIFTCLMTSEAQFINSPGTCRALYLPQREPKICCVDWPRLALLHSRREASRRSVFL